MDNKKKIKVIDYIGNSDNTGKPLGHPVKVLKEYSNLIKNSTNMKIVAPKIYKEHFGISEQIDFLKYSMNMFDYSIGGKFKNIIGRILNLRKIFMESNKEEVLWFVNIDIIIYIYIYLFVRKGSKKIVLTQYKEICRNKCNLIDKYMNRIMKNVYAKVTVIISSNELIIKSSEKAIEIPDYFNDVNTFKKYINNKKKNEVAIVGTIMESKDYELAINTIKGSNINLKIIGEFHDKDKKKNLEEMSKDFENILIIDKNLNYNEYYTCMSEAKYIMLPYRKEYYNNRTSGVLIEARFLDCIPIAPKYLLEFNKINGIAYENEIDLKSIIDEGKFILSNFGEDIEKYNIDKIKQKLLEVFSEI